MKQLPTWWYKTEYFWLGYPHREMTWRLKTYYLVQAAYWCQQTIILALKIEKPRKDFKELVAHVSSLVGSADRSTLSLSGSSGGATASR